MIRRLVACLCVAMVMLGANIAFEKGSSVPCHAEELAETTAGDAAPATAKGVISGRVVTETGTPVTQVAVTLWKYHFPSQRFGHLVPVGRPFLTDIEGRFKFDRLDDGTFLLDLRKKGFARSICNRMVENGLVNSTVDVTLQLPVTAELQVVDEKGAPVAGASVRQIAASGVNGNVRLPQMQLRDLDFAGNISDARGILKLEGLPDGSVLKVTLEHPRFAPARIEQFKIVEGAAESVIMKPGIVLSFRRRSKSEDEAIPNAVLDLRHEQFESPSTTIQYQLEFNEDGLAKMVVAPGHYDFLRLQHDDFYLTPTLIAEGLHLPSDHPLHFKAGRDVEFNFDVHRQLTARGRVIDADTGQPIAGESLLAEVVSQNSDPSGERIEFNFTNWGETNSQGEYTIPVVAGRMRVEFHGTNRISESEYTTFEVPADGNFQIPDILVRSLPTFRGRVLNPDGTAATKAVVRFRGQVLGSKSLCNPVVTDDQGRFELQPEFIVKDDRTRQRQLEYSIVAFDAFRPLAVSRAVRFDRSEELELTLEPHEFDWPLTQFMGELTEWEQGRPTPEQQARNLKNSSLGTPAPDLECVDWINSDGLTWPDLRGKYVLLDFWFIGCGPCHAEFPTVKLLHELYHDKGLVVIGLHNNLHPPAKVREHVSEIALPFPVGVDYPDGRMVLQFESRHLVSGYPSYILIDPEGKIVLDDRTIPRPTLRGYKIEILRNLLFGQPRSAAVPQPPKP